MAPLSIIHVFRAPVGGLFRHVLDLATEQTRRGHRVGLIADALTGGARADEVLRQLEPSLALGLLRIPMRRHLSPSDIFSLSRVMRRLADKEVDVVHGHGSKGGAYARLAFNRRRAVRAYTPHGGSLLFDYDTLSGKVYLNSERLLKRWGDLYLFESDFSRSTFARKIGPPDGLIRIVHNGVPESEFEPVATASDASDLIYIGELRMLKGVDVLIDAIARLRSEGRKVSATLVGDGPDRDVFRGQVERLALGDLIRFPGAMPARKAQALGRVMVVPSRMESLPYVVLEAAASGKPLIATRVGGIAEIYGAQADQLVPSDNPAVLGEAIRRALDEPELAAQQAATLRQRIAASFSLKSMVDGVLEAYREALAMRAK